MMGAIGVIVWITMIHIQITTQSPCCNIHDANTAINIYLNRSSPSALSPQCRSCFDQRQSCTERIGCDRYDAVCDESLCDRALAHCSGLHSSPALFTGSTSQPNLHFSQSIPTTILTNSITNLGQSHLILIGSNIIRFDRHQQFRTVSIVPNNISLTIISDDPVFSDQKEILYIIRPGVDGLLQMLSWSNLTRFWSTMSIATLPKAVPNTIVAQRTVNEAVWIAYRLKDSGRVQVAKYSDGVWRSVKRSKYKAGADPAIEVTAEQVNVLFPRHDLVVIHLTTHSESKTELKTKATMAILRIGSRVLAVFQNAFTTGLDYSVFNGVWLAPQSTSQNIDALSTPILMKVDEGGNDIVVAWVIDGRVRVMNGRRPDIWPSTWMWDLRHGIGAVPLNQLTIPGAHDAATAGITAEAPVAAEGMTWLNKIGSVPIVGNMAKQVAARWATAQGHSIIDQLRHGVRYLDLRITVGSLASPPIRPSTPLHDLYMVHGLLSVKFVDVVADLQRFLAESAHEVVVVDIQHEIDIDSQRRSALYDHLQETFPSQMALRSNISSKRVNLDEMWRMGYRLIVLSGSDSDIAMRPWIWSRHRTLQSPWANVPNADRLRPLLDRFVAHRDPDRLFVLQGVCTADMAMIYNGVLSDGRGPQTLHQLASNISQSLIEWVNDWPPLNIIMVDWIQDSSIVAICLRQNIKRFVK